MEEHENVNASIGDTSMLADVTMSEAWFWAASPRDAGSGARLMRQQGLSMSSVCVIDPFIIKPISLYSSRALNHISSPLAHIISVLVLAAWSVIFLLFRSGPAMVYSCVCFGSDRHVDQSSPLLLSPTYLVLLIRPPFNSTFFQRSKLC